MLLDATVSGVGLGALALICPLMMVLMMVGMALMGGGHGPGMCGFWSHGPRPDAHPGKEDEGSKQSGE